MASPQVLLMDQPSLGLAHLLIKQVFEIITQLSKEGMTILLSEQNARAALKVAHHGVVLETGKVVFFDTAIALQDNPVVQQSYLGVS